MARYYWRMQINAVGDSTELVGGERTP